VNAENTFIDTLDGAFDNLH